MLKCLRCDTGDNIPWRYVIQHLHAHGISEPELEGLYPTKIEQYFLWIDDRSASDWLWEVEKSGVGANLVDPAIS